MGGDLSMFASENGVDVVAVGDQKINGVADRAADAQALLRRGDVDRLGVGVGFGELIAPALVLEIAQRQLPHDLMADRRLALRLVGGANVIDHHSPSAMTP